jgi:replicative DNA helicase
MNDTEEISGAQSEAEESLLGAIIIESSYDNGKSIKQVMSIIKPEDFRGCVINDPPWRWTRRARIFHAMTKCENPPHEINLAYKLAELNMLNKYDCSYLISCSAMVPCSLNYMEYARKVREYSVNRQVKEYATAGNINKLHEITKIKARKGFEL